MTLTHLGESLCSPGGRLALPVINAPVGQLVYAVTLSMWRTRVRIPTGVPSLLRERAIRAVLQFGRQV